MYLVHNRITLEAELLSGSDRLMDTITYTVRSPSGIITVLTGVWQNDRYNAFIVVNEPGLWRVKVSSSQYNTVAQTRFFVLRSPIQLPLLELPFANGYANNIRGIV